MSGMSEMATEEAQPLLEALTKLGVLMGNHPVASADLYKAVVGALKEALRPSFVYLFAPSRGNARSLVPVQHVACGQAQPPPHVRLEAGQGDLLCRSLTEDNEVFIETAQGDAYRGQLPEWVSAIRPTQLLLLPIVSDGHALAFLLVGNVDERRLPLSSVRLRQLKALRLQLATALRLAGE